MKATKITNVNHVVNHFHKQDLYRSTYTHMKATKITNVNLVVPYWLQYSPRPLFFYTQVPTD